MGKDKNDKNETPIRFHIRSTGTPIPTNHPKWEYKKESETRPTTGEWVIIGIPYLFILVIAVVALFQSEWLCAIPLLAVSFGVLISLFRREMYFQDHQKLIDGKSPPLRKKKQPKHRKDYK